MNFCKYQTNLCFIWTICVTFTISGRSSWQCSECCPFIFRMWRYFDIALSYRFVYIIYVVKIISSTSESKQMWFWIFMFLRGCFRTRSRANLFFVQEVVFPPSDWYINYLFKNTSVVSNSMSNYNSHARSTSKWKYSGSHLLNRACLHINIFYCCEYK